MHMCCFPAPIMRYNGVKEEAERMKDQSSGRKENSSFQTPQCCLNIQCVMKRWITVPPQAWVWVGPYWLALNRGVTPGIFCPVGISEDLFSWTESLGLQLSVQCRTGRPTADDRRCECVCECACVTLMAEQNHIPTGSRCVSDTVIQPGDSQTQIIGGIDWLPEPLQWRPMSLIHMENNRVFDCNSTPADCSGSRAKALFH